MTEDEALLKTALEYQVESLTQQLSTAQETIRIKHGDNVALWKLVNTLAETNKQLSDRLDR